MLVRRRFFFFFILRLLLLFVTLQFRSVERTYRQKSTDRQTNKKHVLAGTTDFSFEQNAISHWHDVCCSLTCTFK